LLHSNIFVELIMQELGFTSAHYWQAVSFCTKRTPLVGGHPQIPRELSCGQAARQTGLVLSAATILQQIKKRADSSLMTATCPLIIGVSLSCFLLLSPLLFISAFTRSS
jgi:hypothetical protein